MELLCLRAVGFLKVSVFLAKLSEILYEGGQLFLKGHDSGVELLYGFDMFILDLLDALLMLGNDFIELGGNVLEPLLDCLVLLGQELFKLCHNFIDSFYSPCRWTSQLLFWCS